MIEGRLATLEAEHADLKAWRDGVEPRLVAATITICGGYDPKRTYAKHDVVMTGGASFVAIKHAPGPCPGSGWRLFTAQGQRGIRGERGPAGPKIKDWRYDHARCTATPILADDTLGPPLELGELFQKHIDYRDGLIPGSESGVPDGG